MIYDLSKLDRKSRREHERKHGKTVQMANDAAVIIGMFTQIIAWAISKELDQKFLTMVSDGCNCLLQMVAFHTGCWRPDSGDMPPVYYIPKLTMDGDKMSLDITIDGKLAGSVREILQQENPNIDFSNGDAPAAPATDGEGA